MKLNKFSITQLLIAAGKARGMTPSNLAHYCDCSEAYFYKLIKDPDFLRLVEWFRAADTDPDNLKFVNLGTLFMDAGKFLYHHGQKIKIGDLDD